MPAAIGTPRAPSGASAPAREHALTRPALAAWVLALLAAALIVAGFGVAIGGSAGGSAAGSAPATKAGGLQASFRHGTVAISAGPAHLAVSASAAGYGSALRVLAPSAPHASGARVTYGHPGLSEWYAEHAGGLEQGFTVWRPLDAAAGGPLTIALRLAGARVGLAPDRQSALLSTSAGRPLRYDGLLARDARGHRLRSWLEAGGGLLMLRVDARGARYPIAIDPLFQQGSKLLAAAGAAPEASFGRSVAVSADGSVALVGAPLDRNRAGSVWALTRAGTSWAVQGELRGGEAQGGEEGEELCEAQGGEEGDSCGYGSSVALSADGSVALIGSPRATAACPPPSESFCPGEGSVSVLTHDSSGWSSSAVLTGGPEESPKGHFGRSVALSADGQVALVGAPADRSHRGAAWVFIRSGSSWVRSGAALRPSDELGEGFFGASVALSADGSEALIGAPGDSGYSGAAWLFTREGSTWTQTGAKLTGAAEIGAAHFGRSVALAGSGDLALIGGFDDAGGSGAAWALARSGASWTQQKLLGEGELGQGFFGYRVALSPDGAEALVGAPYDDGKIGAVWAFASSGSTWSPDGGKVTPRGEEGRSGFGYSLALSDGAEAVLVGGPFDNRKFGAVWPFGPHEPPEEEPERSREVKKTRHVEEESSSGQAAPGSTVPVPAGGVLGSGPVRGGASCALALASRNVAVAARGRLAVRLRVSGTALCRGTLRLTVVTRRAHGRARVRTIAGAAFVLRPGALRSVAVRLNATGRALLRGHHGRLNASLALVRLAPAPVLARTASVRLSASTPHRHRH